MTAQGSLFDAERLPTLPHAGLTRIARECSIEAARAAAPRRGRLQERYLQYLELMGSATDQMAAKYLRCPVSSVNSTRNGINAQAREADGIDAIAPAGKARGEFGTPNTLWSLR
jgi:hypothetical protein